MSRQLIIEKNGNRINYQFLIQHLSLSNENLINLLKGYCKIFEPKSMFGEANHFDESSYESIKSLNLKFEGLLIEGNDTSSFGFGSLFQNRLQPRKSFSTIYTDRRLTPIDDEIMKSFLNIDCMKISFMINTKYNFYQSDDNPQSYKYINTHKYGTNEKEIKEYEKETGLSLYLNERIQSYCIDISNNPGRERFLPGMKFIPAYKIWYGKEAQDLFGKQKILDYPNAIYTKELENGVIEMQLMDDITKCDLPYNQEKQRDIVKYFEIEKLEVDKY